MYLRLVYYVYLCLLLASYLKPIYAAFYISNFCKSSLVKVINLSVSDRIASCFAVCEGKLY